GTIDPNPARRRKMQEATTGDGGGRPTRSEAAFDVAAVLVLVPVAAVGSGIVLGLFSADTPGLAPVVLVQALLVLAGVYVLVERRGQRFADIGLAPFAGRDLGRAVVIVL